METKEKIIKDIDKLERNLNEVKNLTVTEKEEKVIKRAIDYKNDSEYYLKKEEYRTAFGCIEYSHGLLDAIKMIYGLI